MNRQLSIQDLKPKAIPYRMYSATAIASSSLWRMDEWMDIIILWVSGFRRNEWKCTSHIVNNYFSQFSQSKGFIPKDMQIYVIHCLCIGLRFLLDASFSHVPAWFCWKWKLHILVSSSPPLPTCSSAHCSVYYKTDFSLLIIMMSCGIFLSLLMVFLHFIYSGFNSFDFFYFLRLLDSFAQEFSSQHKVVIHLAVNLCFPQWVELTVKCLLTMLNLSWSNLQLPTILRSSL